MARTQPEYPGPARVAVITAGNEQTAAQAAKLARELSLPSVEDAGDSHGQFDFLLAFGERGLELRELRRKAPSPIRIDYVAGPVGHRGRKGTSKRQPLALAVGLRSGAVTVVDATAGLGRDAFHLACLGCTVTAVERCNILAALISDALTRARDADDERLRAIVERMKLVSGDARPLLDNLPEERRPDVVYLDPMYVPRRKVVAVKKEMRICRRLVGDDADAEELFAVAHRTARKRVVVKRHPRAPVLSPEPGRQYTGTTVRYDVYYLT